MQPDLPSADVMAADLAQVDRRLLQHVAGGIGGAATVIGYSWRGGLRVMPGCRPFVIMMVYIKRSVLATWQALPVSSATPREVWEWYQQRREQGAACEPHPGQRALALLEQHRQPPVAGHHE